MKVNNAPKISLNISFPKEFLEYLDYLSPNANYESLKSAAGEESNNFETSAKLVADYCKKEMGISMQYINKGAKLTPIKKAIQAGYPCFTGIIDYYVDEMTAIQARSEERQIVDIKNREKFMNLQMKHRVKVSKNAKKDRKLIIIMGYNDITKEYAFVSSFGKNPSYPVWISEKELAPLLRDTLEIKL